jgi:methionine-rich copper-binding protein CopC
MNALIPRTALIVALACTASATMGAISASAHGEVVKQTPLANAVLRSSPTSVAITFDSALMPAASMVVVNSAEGKPVHVGGSKINDRTISTSVSPKIRAGKYTVAYRVVCADGHVESNSYTFTVKN